MLSEQKCRSINLDFSATRGFQDEPLISLQQQMALGRKLLNTWRHKPTNFRNHVDLIIVFLTTTHWWVADVLDGAMNRAISLVNGITLECRPMIVCLIIQFLSASKHTGWFSNQVVVGSVTIMQETVVTRYPLVIFGRFLFAKHIC